MTTKTITKLEIKKIPLSEIKPYFRNPRKNVETVKLLKESIKRYGFNVPLVLDKKKVIITGHARYLALQSMGEKAAFCVISDMSEKLAREYRIDDNKIAESSTWLESELYMELRELDPVIMKKLLPDMKEMYSELKVDNVGITGDEIQKMGKVLDHRFEEKAKEGNDRKIEVECPECHDIFYVNKDDLK